MPSRVTRADTSIAEFAPDASVRPLHPSGPRLNWSMAMPTIPAVATPAGLPPVFVTVKAVVGNAVPSGPASNSVDAGVRIRAPGVRPTPTTGGGAVTTTDPDVAPAAAGVNDTVTKQLAARGEVDAGAPVGDDGERSAGVPMASMGR